MRNSSNGVVEIRQEPLILVAKLSGYGIRNTRISHSYFEKIDQFTETHFLQVDLIRRRPDHSIEESLLHLRRAHLYASGRVNERDVSAGRQAVFLQIVKRRILVKPASTYTNLLASEIGG